jgi:hypothetical protein
MILLGVDISSTFIAEAYYWPLEEKWLFHGTEIDIRFGNLHERRMHRYRAAFERGKSVWECAVALVEQPMGRFRSIAEVDRVTGAYMAGLALAYDAPAVNMMGPTEWRKKIGLKGNCKKPEVMELAASRHPPVSAMRQDFADAMCLALAAEHLIEW